MATNLNKILLVRSLCYESSFLGIVSKRCYLNSIKKFSPILSSLQASKFSSEVKETELESQDTFESQIPDLSKIITESEKSFKAPVAAYSHRSPSVFDDELSNKFINCMMRHGRKSMTRKAFNKALQVIKENQLEIQKKSKDPDKVETDPLVIFHQAIENVMPVVCCIPLRKGGRVYQVPSPLTPNRRRFLAIKWTIDAAKASEPKYAHRHLKLAKQLLDSYNYEGVAIKKKQDLHKTAESNRAFAHFRWW